MATRIWNGATGDWTTDADWTPATSGNDVPQPGDTAVIASGTVILTDNTTANKRFENNTVTLGGSSGATLLLRDDQPTGRNFNVTIAGMATIEADGLQGFAGSITGNPNDGSTITLKADPGGELVLLHGGSFSVTDREIDFSGAITLERDASISGNIVNNGTLTILSGTTTLASNSLTGSGTIAIGSNAKLNLSTPVAATQTIDFEGAGGVLSLTYQHVGDEQGKIEGFSHGDFIDFLGFGPATSETIDTVAHTLTINDSTGRSYVYNNFYGEAGTLTATQQSNGHDLIGYADSGTLLNNRIDAGAKAEHADVVHTMTVPGTTTPITGAGVKVGIISDSYNLGGGASADITNGYLPANGVTVLREGQYGEDEGRAMAELIHQVAPDAQLYFASTGSGVDDFASSVAALEAAGCTIIVDDISLTGGEPFYQLGSPAENAISSAIANGVTFVTSAGNSDDSYYEHTFNVSQETLLDGSVVDGMTFSNGTPYQSFTATGGQWDSIYLQWDAPFYGVGGVASDQPDSVAFKIFDSSGNLVGTSHQVTLDGHLVAESEIDLPASYSTKTYSIAIYHVDGTPDTDQIKYDLFGVGFSGGAGSGGHINDPEAGVGSGVIDGHALVPGEITVAATDVTNTSATGQQPDYTEYFSSTGTGTLYYDANGNKLAQPITVGSPDLTGVDGVYTSVPGFTPFYGTSAAAPDVAGVIALMQQVNPDLTPAQASYILTHSATPLSNEPNFLQGAGLVQADSAIALEEQVACYCAGTRILTDRGEVDVEALSIGDYVLSRNDVLRPIRWLARRSYEGRFLKANRNLLPVCFTQGALGDNVPQRDLWVSPHHAMYIDGILVEAKDLLNDISIYQADDAEAVDYFHIELDSHDVIVAEGALSETYLEDGDRSMFHNAQEYRAIYPDGSANESLYCAPRINDGFQLEAIRERLTARARRLTIHAPRDLVA